MFAARRHILMSSAPAKFQKALDMSNCFMVNLDIGHSSAAGFDQVAYITKHHARITHLAYMKSALQSGEILSLFAKYVRITAFLLRLCSQPSPVSHNGSPSR